VRIASLQPFLDPGDLASRKLLDTGAQRVANLVQRFVLGAMVAELFLLTRWRVSSIAMGPSRTTWKASKTACVQASIADGPRAVFEPTGSRRDAASVIFSLPGYRGLRN
jgi:hypothetical protein